MLNTELSKEPETSIPEEISETATFRQTQFQNPRMMPKQN